MHAHFVLFIFVGRDQVSPLEFSTRMCAELGVGSMFVQPIAQSINQQLIEHKRKVPGWALQGTVAPARENMKEILIDVRFRSVVYRDCFQWDVNCLHNSPERFARSTVADLKLPQVSTPTTHSVLQKIRFLPGRVLSELVLNSTRVSRVHSVGVPFTAGLTTCPYGAASGHNTFGAAKHPCRASSLDVIRQGFIASFQQHVARHVDRKWSRSSR